MTSYGKDEWFWAIFEPTPTWPNFTFGQLVMWIRVNKDHICLSMGWTSDSEQYSNILQLDLISLLVNFSCELGKIMTRYLGVGTKFRPLLKTWISWQNNWWLVMFKMLDTWLVQPSCSISLNDEASASWCSW